MTKRVNLPWVILLISFYANAQYRPEQAFPDLFKQLQTTGIFPDSKTFADAIPMNSTSVIEKAYQKEKNKPSFDLKSFLEKNFRFPQATSSPVTDKIIPLDEHIEK